MNRIIASCGLLMLGMTAACAAEVGPPPEQEPQKAPSAPKVASAPAQKREGAPFSPRVLGQLAARGIKVHDGSKPEPKRTTVELPWIVAGNVPGDPMPLVQANNPTTVPERYAVHLGIRLPLVVKSGDGGEPYVDQARPGDRREDRTSCSGTLVGRTAVLTAGHCAINWRKIGQNATTGVGVYAKVRAYSITASPRRNGASKPYGEIAVKKLFWEFSNWPSSNHNFYDMDHDYAVARLARPPVPAIPTASLRDVTLPQGMIIEFAHYPFASRRGYRMYHSAGFVGDVRSGFMNTYQHGASTEPGSSGAGFFETGVDSVVGLHTSAVAGQTAPGQIKTGFPNRGLMLTPGTRANVLAWTNASF